MKTENGYTHVLKYTGLFGGVQGLGIAVTLVRNKCVALLLGPSGMGLVSLFNSATNFFAQATDLGIPFSAVRHISELYDSGRPDDMARCIKTVRTWSLIVALAGMLLLATLGPLLSGLLAWGDHTAHLVMLSPVVAMLAITGGETAILKGMRRLKPMAAVQTSAMLAALAISVPVYYIFGTDGIVAALLAIAAATMAITMLFSCRIHPYTVSWDKDTIGGGREMIRLGVAFVTAGAAGCGAELAIRTIINAKGCMEDVGLYNAAYTLTITYAGMVFAAMETDYFPRLSAIAADTAATNIAANRQIEVSLLLVSPMLAALIALLPIMIPLLYSGRFAAVTGMAQIAAFSMYFKAVTLPVEYINLARGDSKSYLAIELFYDITVVAFIAWGYTAFGLWGTGLALSLCHLLNLAIVLAYARLRYGFRLSAGATGCLLAQTSLGMAAYAATYIAGTGARLSASIATAAASCAISLYIIMYKKTALWEKIKNKMSRHA